MHAIAYDAVRIDVVFAAEGFLSGSDFVVRFPTLAGRAYRLEESFNLLPGSWTTRMNSIPGYGGVNEITVTGVLSQTQRFYRVKVLPKNSGQWPRSNRCAQCKIAHGCQTPFFTDKLRSNLRNLQCRALPTNS